MQTRTYPQRLAVRPAIQGQLPAALVLFLLSWFMWALAVAAITGVVWVGWVIGALLSAAMTAGIIRLRVNQLLKAAGRGHLTVSETGLVAEFGGSTRTVRWGDIYEYGELKYPSSTAGTFGGAAIGVHLIVLITNLAMRGAAKKVTGVLATGVWLVDKGTMAARKLHGDTATIYGAHPSTGQEITPIWFSEYEAPEGELESFLRHYRPDLVAAAPAAAPVADAAQAPQQPQPVQQVAPAAPAAPQGQPAPTVQQPVPQAPVQQVAPAAPTPQYGTTAPATQQPSSPGAPQYPSAPAQQYPPAPPQA